MARVALVSGSARGIGRAIALELAGRGYDIAVHYRKSREEGLVVAEEARKKGVRSLAMAAEVTQAAEARDLVEQTVSYLGSLDVLVNNVGDYLYQPVEELSAEAWRGVLDSNLNATFYLTQAALPHLVAARGRVVNLGYAGVTGLPAKTHITPYVIAKAGVVMYSRALAKRLAPKGVTINVVAPGVVENSLTKPQAELPMGRVARLDEVVSAVCFFLEPEAAYITGQVLEVAGGWNL